MTRHVAYHLRRQVLGHLAQDTTLDSLAAALGKSDARILWHLRQLASDGLVEPRDHESSWHRTEAGEALLVRDAPEPRHVAFPDRIVTDFEDALLEIDDGLYGNDAVQAGGEHRTRLSTAQATEFRDRLLDLIEEHFAPGRGDRDGIKYGFHWILSPIDLHPLKEIREREAARTLIALAGSQPDLEIPPRRRSVDINGESSTSDPEPAP